MRSMPLMPEPSMAEMAAPPAPGPQAPEMGPDDGEGLAGKVISALEDGLAGATDPKEIAAVLRELADMVEGGMGEVAPGASETMGG